MMVTRLLILTLTALTGCTLLLPTEEIIVECTVPEDCGAGFLCEENACLPEDTDDNGTGQ
jgi:hypothetical protein